MKRKVERSDDFVQASVVTHRHFDRCVFNSSNSHRYANIVVRVDFGTLLVSVCSDTGRCVADLGWLRYLALTHAMRLNTCNKLRGNVK